MTSRTFAILAISVLLAALRASAAERELGCTLQSHSSDWSAVYQQGTRAGTVTCQDGSSMPVTIKARGVGLSAGKWRIDRGTGTFTRVHAIQDVLGRYATVSGNLGLVKTGDVEAASKGRVSLALAGHGEGVDVGVVVSEFHIEKAGDVTAGKPKPAPPRSAPTGTDDGQ